MHAQAALAWPDMQAVDLGRCIHTLRAGAEQHRRVSITAHALFVASFAGIMMGTSPSTANRPVVVSVASLAGFWFPVC